MATEQILVPRTCPFCGKDSSITVDLEAFNEWMGGKFVQDAFPNLPADQREILISGSCPKCFDDVFKEDEDEV